MEINRKIVLITSGQPASNPRLTKEAVALKENGYNVTVVYNFWVKWADEGDKQILLDNPEINWIRTGGHPQEKKSYYFFTRIRFKLVSFIACIFKESVFWQERSIGRCFYELKNIAKKHKADLYIAHNLAALAPAAIAAKKNNAAFAFDAEDYHRGEVNGKVRALKKIKLIEDAYLPGLSYISAASPLIAKAYRELYPTLKPAVINNVFSKKYLAPEIKKENSKGIFKLFWFSQTVGTDRGLKEAIKAMGILKDFPIQLTILGSCSDEMKSYFKKIAVTNNIGQEQIVFLDPVSPSEIFSIAKLHHAGLALENAHNHNRDICLTNKIFTYLLSGLAIIATETKAQKDFLNTYKEVGQYYPIENANLLAEILKKYISDPELLAAHRQNALKLAAEKLNWETESLSFLSLVKNAIA